MIKNFFKGVFGLKKIRLLESQVETLKSQNSALNEEINELKSNRYIVKKIPSGRKPKCQTMHTKITHYQSGVRKELEKINKNRE